MKVDVLIIGQGISGTFLSYYLQKERKSYLIIDDNNSSASSKIAAGIINPVTGRRLVTVWMADDVLPFAWKAYNEISEELGITAISQKNIIDFFPNPFMRENFLNKIGTGDKYVHTYPEQNHFNHLFNYEFGCGEIRPVYTAHLETLLPHWRKHLIKSNVLLEKIFDMERLEVDKNRINYEGITADKIIFCDGTASFENPLFRQLPFAPNKGEALLVEIPDLPTQYVYKKSMLLVPLQGKEANIFWLGSSYIWDFDSAAPTQTFRESSEKVLQEWLKIPFRIIEHRSGLRPATLERRPFVGIHPMYESIGILNGMGTKGCSLAPFFARQLVDHLFYGMPIARDADVARFKKILTKGTPSNDH